MAAPYLTSSTLLEAIKKQGQFPSSQITFTDTELLAIANDEVKVGIVPSIKAVREEYFLFSEDITLVASQSAYKIPYRAIGNSIRDLALKDNNGNTSRISRIFPEERSYFESSQSGGVSKYFFLLAGDVRLVPDVGSAVEGSLVFLYYMRPNMLVASSRVGEVSAISTESAAITSIGIGAGTVSITSTSHGLTNGDYVRISGSDCAPVVDGLHQVIVVDANTYTISTTVTSVGTIGLGKITKITLSNSTFPTNLTASSLIDFVEIKNPHRLFDYDITLYSIDASNKILKIDPNDLPTNLSIGDRIGSAEETDVVMLPDDVHSVLVHRVVARCLDAQGDIAGLGSINAKIQEMEAKTVTLLDDRTEGNPKKVNNLRGILRRRSW